MHSGHGFIDSFSVAGFLALFNAISCELTAVALVIFCDPLQIHGIDELVSALGWIAPIL
ncbi:MAG: hypothetical protein P8L31_08120 [Pseudomonadales bacterium]|nr:hypothetical protein [Pseudomonadales bacterium]